MTFIADAFNVPHKERKERIEKYSKLFEMEASLTIRYLLIHTA